MRSPKTLAARAAISRPLLAGLTRKVGLSGQRSVGRRQFVVGEAFDEGDHLKPFPRSQPDESFQ
jgi:hypothetical protein